MLFVLGVFIVAGLGHPMPILQTSPMTAVAAMPEMPQHMYAHHMHAADHQAPIPCKAPMPNCDSSVGCIFMVALPPAFIPTAVPMAWSRVNYINVAAVPVGVAPQPDLGPPILV
jgi:hypothetical protein